MSILKYISEPLIMGILKFLRNVYFLKLIFLKCYSLVIIWQLHISENFHFYNLSKCLYIKIKNNYVCIGIYSFE